MRPIQKRFAQARVVRQIWRCYIEDFGAVDPEMQEILTEIAIDMLSNLSDSTIKQLAQMLLTVADDERDRAELQAILRM